MPGAFYCIRNLLRRQFLRRQTKRNPRKYQIQICHFVVEKMGSRRIKTHTAGVTSWLVGPEVLLSSVEFVWLCD